MASDTARIGRIGEGLAVRHLEGLGYVVLDRNWRCAEGAVRGEIDVVARDGDVLVFCEVKTRRRVAAGVPVEAVDGRKLGRLRRLGAAWLAAHGWRGDVRFDVVAVSWPSVGGSAQVVHLEGVGL
jgi:putative endonuclease